MPLRRCLWADAPVVWSFAGMVSSAMPLYRSYRAISLAQCRGYSVRPRNDMYTQRYHQSRTLEKGLLGRDQRCQTGAALWAIVGLDRSDKDAVGPGASIQRDRCDIQYWEHDLP